MRGTYDEKCHSIKNILEKKKKKTQYNIMLRIISLWYVNFLTKYSVRTLLLYAVRTYTVSTVHCTAAV